MKNIFRSLLLSVAVLSAGFAVSCTEPEPEHFNGTPTIEVAPAELTMPLAGGTTEAVAITTPAEWSIEITGATDVTASATEGFGNAAVTFEVPAVTSMRTIKAVVTATGYISGYPITKKAEITIVQSDNVLGSKIYYEDCGSAVSKVDGYWPYVDKYEGWNPQGAEGIDQSGVTYTGKSASVRNSGKYWAPVDAIYATDAPYAHLQAKNDVEFIIHNINIKSGVKSYTFSFTAHNQYANLKNDPFSPAPVSPLKSGENLTVEVSVDGTNFGAITYTTMADGNWEYAIAPFTLPADADKLFVRFSGYKADTTTALPSSEYQYQAGLRVDDFTLTEGGDGPVVDFNNAIGGGGNTGGGDVPTEAVKATVAEFLAADEDGTTYYELTGVISNVQNTTYGNFDLTDETGTVYIYGLSSPTGEQKYWAASGAKAGDTITVRTLRTSYNNTPQGKDAIFVSLIPGEGGQTPTPEPAEGIYASDVAFVCATDDSASAVYGLGDTALDGQAVTGFKLGKSKQQGKFVSGALGVSGDKYLNFYAVAWKGTTATLYFRVDGGTVQSVNLTGNVGATGNSPYVALAFAKTDHYSVKLEGLTATSTIEFSTNADFALTTHSGSAPDIAPRAIVCGVKLTDEPIDTENTGGDNTGGESGTLAAITSTGDYTVNGAWVVATYARGCLVTDSSNAYMLCYLGTGVDIPAVGAVVNISGAVSEYAGLLQFGQGTTLTATGETKSVELGTPTVMGATELDAYVSSPAVKYVQYEGKLEISGYYYNVTIDGASTAIGSLSYPDTAMAEVLAPLNGTNIKVTGFLIGVSSGKYTNTMVTAVEGLGGTPTPEPEPTPDPTPTEGNFASDAAFVQSADDSAIAAYSLGSSTVNGNAATGFKLGTGSKFGTFTSAEVGVTGDKTLEFYAFAWKGKKATLYVKVEGGGAVNGSSSFELTANTGATGNPPFTITATSSDLYTVNLTGLTATSKVIISTAADFAGGSADTTGGNCRAVVAGVHLK